MITNRIVTAFVWTCIITAILNLNAVNKMTLSAHETQGHIQQYSSLNQSFNTQVTGNSKAWNNKYHC